MQVSRAAFSLCLLTLWCGASHSAAPATAAGQAQLIQALDLSRPELEGVRTAWQKHDLAAARHAFAEHLRARTNVHWRPNAASQSESETSGEQRTADDAVERAFTVVNIRYQFPSRTEIDWAFNPTAQPNSKNALNHEWTWQFNRMYFWPPLAHVYRATGQRKYADELTRGIVSWIAANPVPAKAENVPYSRWRTIEAGIRMFASWPDVFFSMVGDRVAFGDDALLAMVDSMRQHAEYLDKFPTGGNWKTMESNGLVHVGVLFPEFKDAARWREDGIKRQHEELSVQVYPDGAQKELAPGYHNVALKQFFGTLDLARANHVGLPPDYAQALEKMFDVNLYLCLPDRTFANFNDSGRGDAKAMLAEGLRVFPNREDWRWIVSDAREGRRPDKDKLFLPRRRMDGHALIVGSRCGVSDHGCRTIRNQPRARG
jgi:hypothetical protein